MPPSTKAVLEQARDLIRDPSTWTAGAFAIDKDGQKLQPDDHQAVAYCALGAVFAAYHRLTSEATFTALDPQPEPLDGAILALARACDADTVAELLRVDTDDDEDDPTPISEQLRDIIINTNDADDENRETIPGTHARVVAAFERAIKEQP